MVTYCIIHSLSPEPAGPSVGARLVRLVNHCGFLHLDGVLVLPSMLCYYRRLQCPFSASLLVFPQPSLQPSGLWCSCCHSCQDLVHNLRSILHWKSIIAWPWSAQSGVRAQTWRTPSSCRTSCTPTWCPHWRLLCTAAPLRVTSSSGESWGSSSRQGGCWAAKRMKGAE